MKQKQWTVLFGIALVMLFSFAVKADTMPGLYSKPQTNSMNQLKRGENALNAGHLEKAEKHFMKAVKLMDENYQAYAYLGIVAFMKRDLKTAQVRFEESLKKFEPYKTLVLDRMREYIRTLETNQGKTRLGLSRSHTPDPTASQSDMEARYDYQQRRIKEFNEEYENFQNMKYPAFFHFKYGNVLLSSGQRLKAKSQYLGAVEADPSYKDAYANLAVCCFLEGDCEQAVKAYKKAKELKAKMNPKFEADLKKKCGLQ